MSGLVGRAFTYFHSPHPEHPATFGRQRKVGGAAVGEDDLALMVREAEAAGRAAWTIKNNLVVASGVFGFAVRRGHIARNPVAHLTRDERPAPNGQERTKAFTREQLAVLLAPPTRKISSCTGFWLGRGFGSGRPSGLSGVTSISARALCASSSRLIPTVG